MATLNGVSVSTTTFNGTTGYDAINGDADSETIYGLDGGDTINGFEGNDYLSGGNGSDLLIGGSGNDTLLGGGIGDDTLSGGIGNDVFVIARQTYYYDEQNITDFTIGQDKLDLSATGISDIETLRFLSIDVTNALAYRIYTGGAYQTITLENQWVDSLTTGDVVLSTTNSAGTLISVTNSSDLFGGAGNDTLVGSTDDDRLFGEADNDSLDGGNGGDLLVGGAGNDTLIGGADNDTLIGGAGSDMFILQNTGSANDQILDFNMVEGDKLDVRLLGIGDLDTLKALAKGTDTIKTYWDGGYYPVETTISGVDVSSLGASNVVLNTVATNDVLTASSGKHLFGAGGNDTLTGSTHSMTHISPSCAAVECRL